ncbi:MAG: aldolase/citrate lyase family protein [Deinococcales bacterium]
MMRYNKLKEIFASGGSVLNGWIHLSSTVAIEAMSQVGFDSLTLDLQHGPLHYDAALPLLQTMSATDVTPLARVPWNEPGIIMKMLDAGCMGIICPMISSARECEAFVQACRYPPLGYRSYGPTRARLYAGADYAKHANTEVLTFAMIETKGAMDELDEIMSVEGLDAIYVGPADLSQALGGPPGADWEEGPVVEALEKILLAAKRHGVVAGIHTGSSPYAQKMIDQGFQFITVQSDLNFLTQAASEVVKAVKESSLSQGSSMY